MTINYTPRGICARQIIIDVEDGIVKDAKIIGGCSGNSQGVGALVKGMNVDEVIKKLENIKCGSKSSSCPAQLAQALKENL